MDFSNLFDIEYRVYIAGILVPSIRANITSAFNTPPSATVTLPPYSELYGIGRGDRIPLHIFVKESWVADQEFILLFEGEVTGFSYVSTALGREINVNAQSVLAVLRDVNIRFMTSVEDMVRNAIIKGETNTARHTVSPGIVFPMSLFMNGLAAVDQSNLIKTPSEYLKNAYTFLQDHESMGGINGSTLAKFYSSYAQRIRLLDRYKELPLFDEVGSVWETASDKAGAFPLIDGLQKQAAIQQLLSMSASAMGRSQGPTRGSVYDLINYIVSQMEYEFAFICSPYYDGKRLASTCLKPILYESFPPACNVLYRPLVDSIQTAENVYQVPTRVRVADSRGPTGMMYQGENSILADYGIIDYWPTEKYRTAEPTADETANWYATERLAEEEHTGTYMFETEAPAWLSYVTPESIGTGTGKELKTRLMKHLLVLKRYEARRMQVQAAFNPYVTPGFPGAVFDADDHRFTFVGHITAVSHDLSKQGCRTSVSTGFTRLVDEAIATPLENTVPKIDAITRDESKISQVYKALLGCSAVEFDTLQSQAESDSDSRQVDPTAAYAGSRRPVVTFDDYLSFMGMSVMESAVDDSGQEVPTVLGGDFVTDRMNVTPADKLADNWAVKHAGAEDTSSGSSLKGIRWVLKQIADREFSNKIYS